MTSNTCMANNQTPHTYRFSDAFLFHLTYLWHPNRSATAVRRANIAAKVSYSINHAPSTELRQHRCRNDYTMVSQGINIYRFESAGHLACRGRLSPVDTSDSLRAFFGHPPRTTESMRSILRVCSAQVACVTGTACSRQYSSRVSFMQIQILSFLSGLKQSIIFFVS